VKTIERDKEKTEKRSKKDGRREIRILVKKFNALNLRRQSR
jgi:hypothetical protein